MNDGNLAPVIDHTDEVVSSQLPHKELVHNDPVHLEASRWWFASSAFPMIAGTLGPVASAFSMCSLVRPWRQRFPPGTDVDDAGFVKDPPWLTIVNAFQLAIAIVANVFLLLNMTRRVRFSVAQPITIVGWYISAILLVSLNATAAGPLQDVSFPADQLIWSQGFWYGVWAAVLYFIDASLMAVTFWGAWTNHYSRDFALTTSQRTLMLQTIMFLGYLLLGALVFSKIEGWNYLDSVYWADVTLFTIGFGDFSPQTSLGRALLVPYALVGIISLGLVIGSIRSMILERGKRRMDARMEEKKRREVVRTMTQRGRDGILQPVDRDVDSSPNRGADDDLPSTEFERRQAEFALMRKIQHRASTRRKWMGMGISTGTWLVLWLVGAVIFMQCEKRFQKFTYFNGFYLCFVSLTTIGYGDVVPVSNAGKSFFVFWSLLALPAMTVLISNAGDTVVKFVKDATISLGNITILPGEFGFLDSLRDFLYDLSLGKLYASHVAQKASPAQFVEHVSAPSDDESSEPTPDAQEADGACDVRGRPGFLDVEQNNPVQRRPATNRDTSTFTSRVRRSLSRLRDPLEDLPTGTDYYFLLISEIQAVSKHLKEPQPRRYTYPEWAWYLRLIGEDERSPETHRKPVAKNKKHAPGGLGDDERSRWSWVGDRSPLIGGLEESDWILERLTERLKDALSAEGRHRAEHKGGGTTVAGWFESVMHSGRPSHEDRREGNNEKSAQ